MSNFFFKPINSLLLAQNKSGTPKANIYVYSLQKKKFNNTLISLVIIQKQGYV